MKNATPRKELGKFREIMDVPNLLAVQKESYDAFLQKELLPEKRRDTGLQGVFHDVFPIHDMADLSYLEFVSYTLGTPKMIPEVCRERGETFAAPLKATLRLVVCEKDKEKAGSLPQVREIKEQEVYLCDLPLMTENGTFIINGAERVVVSQLHRSPGLVFEKDEERSTQSGSKMFVARIIPYRGIWLEFEFDLNGIMFAKIDRRKKVLASTLLRALPSDLVREPDDTEEPLPPFDSDEKILRLFYAVEDIPVENIPQRQEVVGKVNYRVTASAIVDPDTGEIIAKGNRRIMLSKEGKLMVEVADQDESGKKPLPAIDGVQYVEKDLSPRIEAVPVLVDFREDDFSICDTLREDKSASHEAALQELHQKMSPTVPFNRRNAEEVIRSNFLGYRRRPRTDMPGSDRVKKCKYDLGEVGRVKVNSRLNHDVPEGVLHLSCRDIAETMKALVTLMNEEGNEDDIDHLGNRRVRAIGELLENQFRIGFARVVKAVRTQMGVMDLLDPKMLPNALLNTKPLAAAVKGFFASSQLCQFMDQTNPLAEITHKRRLSALGPGGLTRDRAGFEVRDVHHSHYGRVCPIETPEGPNIGLISSLATYARINRLGFLETPYRKVTNGKVSDDIAYLDADKEDRSFIVEAMTPMDTSGKLTSPQVWARHRGDITEVPPTAVDYMDISPKQLVSVATALIPFLEHDDANRALMGSNMQRQAVPLVRTEPPLIGTGMERVVARDSGMAVVARRAGTVASVDASRIVIYADTIRDKESHVTEAGGVDIYNMVKFQRSNQSTCLNQKPLVKKGQGVKTGEVIADGPAMAGGELALGAEVLCAFMPWRGYNFEDAVVISERLLKQDIFSSIHVEEYEEKACDTKLGPEEITRDVPNVSEEALRNIDEDGLARVGAEVVPGDILVSRVAPKGDTEQTPEEKLLRAIFGEKAEDVRDTSLRVPPGVDGKVLRKKIFARKNREERLKSRDLSEIKALEADKECRIEACKKRYEGEIADREAELAEKLKGVSEDSPKAVSLREGNREALVRMRQLLAEETEAIEREVKEEIERIKKGDELLQTVLKLAKIYIAKKRRISVGDKVAGRHGNKGVVARILPEEDMPHLPDGTPVDMVLNPLGVPSRMNVGQIYETHMGWAAQKMGRRVACPVFDGVKGDDIRAWLREAGLPEDGKVILYDGYTGEPFEQPVTVGYIYMMKLVHLVEGKIHARSTGPYSLVSQQPLGGKAQFGGQRFGEMEVWALEGYGAAHTLQEILTVKSDDVTGRAKVYEALVKGQNVPPPGIPESFNVLVKELQSLGLNVEISSESRQKPARKGREEKPEDILGLKLPERQEV